MVESVVKLQEKSSSKASTTAADQAVPRPVAEDGPWRPPASTYSPWTKVESQTPFASIGINPSINAQRGSHGPDKESYEWHTKLSHSLPCNHSRVIYAEHEDDGDDDRPKEHAFWILVGSSASSEVFRH